MGNEGKEGKEGKEGRVCAALLAGVGISGSWKGCPVSPPCQQPGFATEMPLKVFPMTD